jgi:alkaline phosphatase
MLSRLLFLVCCIAYPNISHQGNLPTTPKKPKNIIFLVGDGMGLTQITAGIYSSKYPLSLESFPITGLIKTHSAKQTITDSGAGATAFSCGCKTYNGAIGVDAHKKPCSTILEQAKARGLAVGLVASCSITHATPASYYAHVASRADTEKIAADLLKIPIDLLIGGGLKYFTQRKTDNRNLYTELAEKGYQLSDYAQSTLAALQPNPDKAFAWFSALDEPESVTKGRDYLPVAAKMAPDFLKKRNENGFFLMLEGSQIDWACHANDAPRAIAEMLDFDAAVAQILNFAQQDGETLVVVTADHETGGMAIQMGSSTDSLEIAFNTGYHTASLVPVFAFGPGAENFGGVYDNTDIYHKMQALWGIETLQK